MNIEKKFNNSPPKFVDVVENDKQKVEKILENIDGLYELLKDIVCKTDYGKFLDEEVSPHIKKIAGHMANDKKIEEAVMIFLSEGGKGYRFHEKGAAIIKNDLEKELKNP